MKSGPCFPVRRLTIKTQRQKHSLSVILRLITLFRRPYDSAVSCIATRFRGIIWSIAREGVLRPLSMGFLERVSLVHEDVLEASASSPTRLD